MPFRASTHVNEEFELAFFVQLQQGFPCLVGAVEEALQFSDECENCTSLLDHLP